MTGELVAALRDVFGGRVLTAGDPGYDQARATLAGGIDNHPMAIAYAADAEDVRRVVSFARDNGVPLAVRSGGHSLHSTTDGGLLLDLTGLNSLEFDVEGRTAWAGSGITAGEFTNAAAAYGLAVGFGDTGSVGLGGITTGGGVGFLARKHGLTVDALIAADVVTADGSLLRVDDDNHPELFWAIRGGGGNFGVVTRFRFRLQPVDTVVGGMLMLPATAATIEGWMTESAAAPEELTTMANVMTAPPMPFVPAEWHGKLVIMGLVCFDGPAEEGERALAPLRALAEPIADFVKPMPYAEIYGPEDKDYHPIAATQTMFIDEVDKAVAETIVERLESSDAMMRVAAAARPGRRGVPGAGVRDGLRPPLRPGDGQPGGAVRVRRGGGRPAAVDQRVRGGDRPGQPRRLRRLRQRRGRGGGAPRLPGRDLCAAGGGEGHLRPGQPVPAQPQHPARGGLTGRGIGPPPAPRADAAPRRQAMQPRCTRHA